MNIWDWANLHPVAFTICVCFCMGGLVEMVRLFKK